MRRYTKESAAAVIHSLAHSMRLKLDPSKHPISGTGLCYVFDNGASFRAEMMKSRIYKGPQVHSVQIPSKI